MSGVIIGIIAAFTVYNFLTQRKFKKEIIKSNQELHEIVRLLNNRK